MAIFKKLRFRSVHLIASSAFSLGLIIVLNLRYSYFSFGYTASERRHRFLEQDEVSKKLNIVVQFPVITKGSSTELVLLRQNEYVETLVKNLAHEQVEKIHLLLEDVQDKSFVEALELERSYKIVYYNLNRRMLYGDAFRYISDFLITKTAVIMNADCYIGQGFQKLDSDILMQKTMYALTRHESPDSVKYCGGKDFCSPFAKYIGSHDAFVMQLNKPLPNKIFDILMVRPDIVGVEKFVIFTLRNIGGFKVRNPCKILHVFHNHCSKLRHAELRLVNGKRLNKIFLVDVPFWKTVAPFSGL